MSAFGVNDPHIKSIQFNFGLSNNWWCIRCSNFI